MIDIASLFLIGIIGFLTGTITGSILIIYIRKSRFIEEILENILLDTAQNEDLLKSLYQIGGIIGQGVKGGIGIQTSSIARGSKFKWQDLLMQLAGDFLSKSMINPSPSPEPSPLPQSKQLKEPKLNDKW